VSGTNIVYLGLAYRLASTSGLLQLSSPDSPKLSKSKI